MSILNAFTAEAPELGVTELADRLALHKSTVHRFLVNLEAAGLVERNPRTNRYRLGLRIFELGGLVLQQMNLWDEALPFLEGLVRDSGETGHLAVLDGGEAIYIEKVEARRALRIPSAMGRGYPAHATNLGKVLLAHLSREELRAVVAEHGLPAYTPHTITDPDRLESELARIRSPGLRRRQRGVRRGPALHRRADPGPHRPRGGGARDRRPGDPRDPGPGGRAGRAGHDGRLGPLPPPRRPSVRGLRLGRAPGAHHRAAPDLPGPP